MSIPLNLLSYLPLSHLSVSSLCLISLSHLSVCLSVCLISLSVSSLCLSHLSVCRGKKSATISVPDDVSDMCVMTVKRTRITSALLVALSTGAVSSEKR